MCQNLTHQLSTLIVQPDPSHDKNLSLKTNILIPLNGDEIIIDGYIAPIVNNTNLALSPDSIIVIRSGNGMIGIRLLYAQMSNLSEIKIRTDGPGKLMPVSANANYSYMYQIDGTGLSNRAGRLAVTHKLEGDTNNQSYHIAFLLATGTYNTETDVTNLAKLVATASFSNSTSNGTWTIKATIGSDNFLITRSTSTGSFSQRLVNDQSFNNLTQTFIVQGIGYNQILSSNSQIVDPSPLLYASIY